MPRKYIKTNAMLSLLNQVHLGGIINEAVVLVKKGKATVEAVDITASVVFISTTSVGPKKLSAEIGLGNIELFKKFLATAKDPKLNIDFTENRMVVSRKDKRRKLEYLLSQPQLIATRLNMDDEDDDGAQEKFIGMVEVRAEIDESFVKDLSSYINTLKTKIVTIDVEESDVTFTLGPKSEHQFKLSLPLTDEADDEFTLKVNGEYLAKILSCIEFDNEEDADPVTIGFGDDRPIVIELEDSMWAISPSEDVDED